MAEATDREKKTFEVTCAACGLAFHVRYPLADPEADGDARVAVDCLHCREQVAIDIPRAYAGKDVLLRVRSSRLP